MLVGSIAACVDGSIAACVVRSCTCRSRWMDVFQLVLDAGMQQSRMDGWSCRAEWMYYV